MAGSSGTTVGEGGTGTGGSAGAGQGGGGGAGNIETTLVALVRASDPSGWADATERAIAMAGGLPDLTGMTVLIRPNVISSDPPPTTTNPEVIRGVIRAVSKQGATTILVGDDGWATDNTVESMNSLGIGQVCQDEGATPIDLKGGTTRPIAHVDAGAWSGTMNVYEQVLDADFIVNVPVCKSHATETNFTMALKAWYGHVPQSARSHQSLSNQVAELHLAKQEGFVVLDCTKAMVTGGPSSGQTAEPQIVVASKDPIAADVTGVCVHKQFGTRGGSVFNLAVWDQPVIKRAMELRIADWLTEATNFSCSAEGIEAAELEEIMAWRDHDP